MEITSKAVADLRAETGVGMMECKKALVEAGGDFEEARKILRKKGLAAAASKAGRATTEGLVVAQVTPKAAVLVEVNCETDFVARTEAFRAFVDKLAERVTTHDAFGETRTGEGRELVSALLADRADGGRGGRAAGRDAEGEHPGPPLRAPDCAPRREVRELHPRQRPDRRARRRRRRGRRAAARRRDARGRVGPALRHAGRGDARDSSRPSGRSPARRRPRRASPPTSSTGSPTGRSRSSTRRAC